MFITTAIANEVAWRALSTDDWVTFKAFGIAGISLIFMVAVPVLSKQQVENKGCLMFQRCIVALSTDSVGRASHYALRCRKTYLSGY